MDGDKCRWCHACERVNMETIVPHHLERLLPEDHFHCICSYIPLEHGFTASVKVRISTREEAEKWLEDFQKTSKVTLRVAKTYPAEDKVRRNSYRVDMRCQHNTRQRGRSRKNTNCPAGLYLVLKKQSFSQNRKSRSTDSHVQAGFLLHVTIKHHHNHRLDCPEALQPRDVSHKRGHSPSSIIDGYSSNEEDPHPAETPWRTAYGKSDAPETWFMEMEFESDGEQAEPEPPPTPGDASTLEERLQSMFDGLVEKLRQNDTFHAPIESFVRKYEGIRTDSDLMSALAVFGETVRETSYRQIQPEEGLQMPAQTGTQPTEMSPRRTPLRGKRALITGQPPKRAQRDRGYGQVKDSPAQCVSDEHSKK